MPIFYLGPAQITFLHIFFLNLLLLPYTLAVTIYHTVYTAFIQSMQTYIWIQWSSMDDANIVLCLGI